MLLDIKLCMQCNNNCIHCVLGDVKRRQQILVDYGELTFKSTLDFIDSEMTSKPYKGILLNGGEPTSLKYYGRLIKYIAKKYPHLEIVTQTNGRWLSRFVDDIEEVSNIAKAVKFIIPILHTDEEVHNSIVRNKFAYQETIESINTLKERLGDKFVWRCEIVILPQNLQNISNIYQYAIDLGCSAMEVAFPDYASYLNHADTHKVEDLYVSYKDLFTEMVAWESFHRKYTDIVFNYFNIPKCVWLQVVNDLTENVVLTLHLIDKDVYVSYLSSESSDSSNDYEISHKITSECKKCRLKDNCYYPFKYAVEYYGDNLGVKALL